MNQKDGDFQKQANQAAHDAILSIKDDLDAYHHAQECDGETDSGKPCKRGSETRKFKLTDGTPGLQMVHNNEESWHDVEVAEQTIHESQYGIQVRSDWHSLGESGENSEYVIILGGGGPASRIIGQLENGGPTSARYEYQNWGHPWTEAETTYEEDQTMLEYAQFFYFGD